MSTSPLATFSRTTAEYFSRKSMLWKTFLHASELSNQLPEPLSNLNL